MNSKVCVSTKFNGKKTVNDDVFFTPPYKIIAPIYNDDEAEIVLLSSSAGLLKGDNIDMQFSFGENSNAKISSQSYEKVFDTLDGKVTRRVEIDVLQDAFVKFMPYPTIPFKNSNFHSVTTVNLAKKSKFCYVDIFSCGRVLSDERFEMNKFYNNFTVKVKNIPVFIDNTLIEPKIWDYDSIGLWHGYTHNGFMYIYGSDDEQSLIKDTLELAKELIPDFEIGASQCKKGICIRILGDSGDRIFKYFKKVSILLLS
ncbi:MAG: urease accessory protein UreD [Clostridia bacterium]